jgi:CheY-like chemotaxis protein
MANKRKSILIIEDEVLLARCMKLMLEDAGYRIFGKKPDLVLIDITLRGKMDGVAVAGKIIEELRIPVIYVTGNSDNRTMKRVNQTRHSGILQKPVEEYELVSIIKNAIGN